MAIIASTKRSSWPLSSLSVGSTISVPATGKLIVGAWKPKSTSRLAMSSFVIPVALVSGRMSRMHSCATRSEEHTSELQSRQYLVCRLLLEKKKKKKLQVTITESDVL